MSFMKAKLRELFMSRSPESLTDVIMFDDILSTE